MKTEIHIVPFERDQHQAGVIDLWTSVFGYETAHNEPTLVIAKKVAESDGLFFVAIEEGVVGTAMCGYDGHRGWIYSLAVKPALQRKGIGGALMAQAERALVERGCMKINLQIIEGNEEAVRFYERMGYKTEPRISMGKRIPANLGSKPN